MKLTCPPSKSDTPGFSCRTGCHRVERIARDGGLRPLRIGVISGAPRPNHAGLRLRQAMLSQIRPSVGFEAVVTVCPRRARRRMSLWPFVHVRTTLQDGRTGPTLFTREPGDHCTAKDGEAGLARRTGRRRIERVAHDAGLGPVRIGVPRCAPRSNHARLGLRHTMLRRAFYGAGAVWFYAAIVIQRAIAGPVASNCARPPVPISAGDEWLLNRWHSIVSSEVRTTLQYRALDGWTVQIATTDLPRHCECSEAEAAWRGAASWNAIRGGVATYAKRGEHARSSPTGLLGYSGNAA